MSRLKRNGNNRLLRERWLPMLELASSLLGGSTLTAATGGIGAVEELDGLRLMVISVSLLSAGALVLSLGVSGLDMLTRSWTAIQNFISLSDS